MKTSQSGGGARERRPGAEAEIVIEGLHRSFGGKPVLRGVDLVVNQGDILAIVGGSGCGKTVLLNHVLGQLTPDRGRVLAVDHGAPDGGLVDVHRCAGPVLERIHRHWGVVFQRNALFSGTVYDNIALWLDEVRHLGRTEIAARAASALNAVGLPSDAEFLAEDHERLSGGMSKRLAVARALVMDPVVVFYDEPTTGLDPSSASQIQDLIQSTHLSGAARGRTTIMITHDKDLLSRLRPRTVMLDQGRVYFDGPFARFIESDSPVIRPYFELMPTLQQRVRVAD